MGGVVRAVTNAVKSEVNEDSKVISSEDSAVTSPFGMNIDVCDFDLLVEAAFYHGGFVSETPKFLLGGLRRN